MGSFVDWLIESAAVSIFLMKPFMRPPCVHDTGALCNGGLVGYGSITAGCSNVEVGSACFIGFVGGLIYLTLSSRSP